jgi:hypothetical protein
MDSVIPKPIQVERLIAGIEAAIADPSDDKDRAEAG